MLLMFSLTRLMLDEPGIGMFYQIEFGVHGLNSVGITPRLTWG